LFFAVNVIYACFGTLFLGARDPLHFGKFSASLLNLYSVTTLEWVDLLQTNLWGCIEYNTGDYDLIGPNELNNNSVYLWDTKVLDGPGWTNSTGESVYAPAGCVNDWGGAGQLLVVFYFFSFVIITVFVLFTMFMGAIAISMAAATEELEKKAALANQSNEQDWSLLHDMTPDVTETMCSKHLLNVDTVVGFNRAKGVSYHDQLKSICSSDGGLVYLSFFDLKHKEMMEAHAVMTQRLIWTFRYLLELESASGIKEALAADRARVAEGGVHCDLAHAQSFSKGVDGGDGVGDFDSLRALQSTKDRNRRASWRTNVLQRIDSGAFPDSDQNKPGMGSLTKDPSPPSVTRRCSDLLLRVFAKVSYFCYKMTQHTVFNLVIIVTIFAVTVEYVSKAQEGTPTLQKFLDESDGNTSVLRISQLVFLVEFIVKLLANGLQPWGYFRSYWNVFDFAILIVGFTRQPGLLVARMLRLFRVMEILGGRARRNFAAFLSSILSFRVIGTLWMIVIFLYAVAGSHVFGGNDPFRFKDAGTAAMTLFWASTMDGLPELMFTNAYGCDSSFSNYGDAIDASECTAPEAQPQLTAFYFATFAIFSHAVLLSVFLGVITISLTKTIDKSKEKDEQRATIKYFKRLFPGNKATIDKLFATFKDLDMVSGALVRTLLLATYHLLPLQDGDGSITPSELCFRFNQVTGAELGETTITRINEWVEQLESAAQADGEISLPEFLEYMIYILIDHDEFNVRVNVQETNDAIQDLEAGEEEAVGGGAEGAQGQPMTTSFDGVADSFENASSVPFSPEGGAIADATAQVRSFLLMKPSH
jgi:hypothetical protein